MYGILLESVQQLIRDRYGDDAWRRVLVEAGLSPHSVFEVHKVYADDVLPLIADACSAVLPDSGRRSADEFLAEFGRLFVSYTSRLGYAPLRSTQPGHPSVATRRCYEPPGDTSVTFSPASTTFMSQCASAILAWSVRHFTSARKILLDAICTTGTSVSQSIN